MFHWNKCQVVRKPKVSKHKKIFFVLLSLLPKDEDLIKSQSRAQDAVVLLSSDITLFSILFEYFEPTSSSISPLFEALHSLSSQIHLNYFHTWWMSWMRPSASTRSESQKSGLVNASMSHCITTYAFHQVRAKSTKVLLKSVLYNLDFYEIKSNFLHAWLAGKVIWRYGKRSQLILARTVKLADSNFRIILYPGAKYRPDRQLELLMESLSFLLAMTTSCQCKKLYASFCC